MTPPAPSSIRRAAAWATQKAPLRLVASTWSHWSGEMSMAGLRTLTPALFTRTSRSPTCSKAASTCSRWPTSQGITPGPGVRARTTTSEPSSRKRCAVAAPIPLVPPVTTTRLPARPLIAPSLTLRPPAVRLYPTHMSEASFIGVVSDTHGYYDPMLDDLFAGAAGIVHAGDIGDLAILARLRGLAPLTAVAGNTDGPFPALDLPWEVEVEIASLRIIVCHIGASLMGRHDPVREGFDLVISGHSHKAAVEWREETLFLNPGAAGRPRRG